MFLLYVIVMISLHGVIFFVKQKTAYEMRISDWSSDVCSSDLSRLQAVRINDVQVERSNDSSASSSGGRGQSMGQEQAGQQNQSQAHKRPLAEAVSMFANGQEPDQPVSARVTGQRARYA